jgi:hypothetical protein
VCEIYKEWKYDWPRLVLFLCFFLAAFPIDGVSALIFATIFGGLFLFTGVMSILKMLA